MHLGHGDRQTTGIYYDIEMEPGTYAENVTNVALTANVRLHSEEPTNGWSVMNTIVDGGWLGPVFALNGSEGRNFIIEGLTIQNGFANTTSYQGPTNSAWAFNPNCGGGIQCNGSAPTIRRCFIVDNSTDEGGYGGGIEGCAGGLIEACVIQQNSASYGGGISFEGQTIVRNCLVTGNFADSNCAAMSIPGGTATPVASIVESCTIASNQVVESGPGDVAAIGTSSACTGTVALTNCIVWDNGRRQFQCNAALGGGIPIAAGYSCIQAYTNGGQGTITSDPLFVERGKRRLQAQPLAHLVLAWGPIRIG